MILKVPYIPQKNPKECAIACVAMILNYYKRKFAKEKFLKKLKVDKYGFSLSDIAKETIDSGYKIEFGFWDSDLIKKGFFDEFPIKPSELEQYAVKVDLNRTFKTILKDILAFFKKHPSSIKIEPVNLQKLDVFLNINVPIIIHVDVLSYFDKTDDSIHSILIIGKENQKYIVLDPLLGKKILPANKLLKVWQNAGGYYLVILR